MGFFKRSSGNPERSSVEGVTRHSRGWAEMNKFLHSREGLRVLDFGATSPANINYLTDLGHSVYMAHPVSDAAAPEWRPRAEPGEETVFDAERFAASALTFSGRVFDVVLLWDTANYLPAPLVEPFFRRMQEVLQTGGKLLAFSHAKISGPDTVFSRYQLTGTDDLLLLRTGPFPVTGLYQTRQIEQFLKGFQDIRLFLGKDNIREVYATR